MLVICVGSLPMDIVWVHNEDELAPDDPDYVQISEGHVHRLLISAVFPEDSGTYICEAYNDYGEADSACELHVLGVFTCASTSLLLLFAAGLVCLSICLKCYAALFKNKFTFEVYNDTSN